MERSEHARELFLSGYNCAQSVLLTFADDLKYSKELAQKMAAGFGGGMGKAAGNLWCCNRCHHGAWGC